MHPPALPWNLVRVVCGAASSPFLLPSILPVITFPITDVELGRRKHANEKHHPTLAVYANASCASNSTPCSDARPVAQNKLVNVVRHFSSFLVPGHVLIRLTTPRLLRDSFRWIAC